MITSKHIIEISERYVDTKNFSGTEVVFYVNPTLSDYAKLYKTGPYIRFIVNNKTKEVYVWDGYLVTHGSVVNGAFLPVNISCVWGQGVKQSDGSLPILTEFRPKQNDTNDYSWISKYVKVPSNLDLNKYYSNMMDKD